MPRSYRRRRSNRNSGIANPLGLLILLTFFLLYRYWKIVIVVLLLIIGIILLLHYQKKKVSSSTLDTIPSPKLDNHSSVVSLEPNQQTYTVKDSMMTDCERSFYDVIKKIVEPDYTIQTQVNLASIVNKESNSRYQNELFRNMDFGIFDKNYKILVLIEINDQTHTTRERRERDQKVKAICAEANIPLITLWTQYGVNESYIKERLSAYLPLSDQANNAIHPEQPNQF